MTEGYETTEEGFEKLQERAAGRDRAHLAIDGLLPDEVTHNLDAMELLYQREMEREASARGLAKELDLAFDFEWNAYCEWDTPVLPWWNLKRDSKIQECFEGRGSHAVRAVKTCREIIRLYSDLLDERVEPIGVLRAMITDLAHAYQAKVAELRVMPIIEARAAEYVKLKARHDDLAQFLMNEFPAEHKLGAVNGRDNFDIAMAVMANYKHRAGAGSAVEVKS